MPLRTVINAIYHRSYQEREPVKVRIGVDEMIILSYPGPDRSVRLDQLRAGRANPRRYRNRRIGEFLKELELTEGRCTGIPKIIDAMLRAVEIQASLGLEDRMSFRETYLVPALESGFVEMTIPSAPSCRMQRYRLTAKGHEWRKRLSQ